jgi:hypothetical protein
VISDLRTQYFLQLADLKFMASHISKICDWGLSPRICKFADFKKHLPLQICQRRQRYQWQIFATGIKDTGGKFANGDNNTGGK